MIFDKLNLVERRLGNGLEYTQTHFRIQGVNSPSDIIRNIRDSDVGRRLGLAATHGLPASPAQSAAD